jgi:hypothetical protein
MSKENGVRTESVGRRNNVLSTKRCHQQERNQFVQRRQPFSRYKEFFYGYCFYCSNFGHKTINCSLRPRNEQLRFQRNKYFPQQRMIQSGNNHSHTVNCQIKSGHIQLRRARNNQQSISREHCNNKFDLLNNEVECYTCHNFGHKSIDCQLRNYEPDSKSPVENVNFLEEEGK